MTERNWKKISGKIVYENPWIRIHEDKVIRPDGREGIYGYLEKPVGVFVVVYNDATDSIMFIRQQRYPINKTILEIPAGVSNSEDYLTEAKRELAEETGLKANKWQHLGGFFIAPGHESTRIEAFLATDINRENIKSEGQEGDEAINEIVEIKIQDLQRRISEGEIECGITLAALNLFFLTRKI